MSSKLILAELKRLLTLLEQEAQKTEPDKKDTFKIKILKE